MKRDVEYVDDGRTDRPLVLNLVISYILSPPFNVLWFSHGCVYAPHLRLGL